MNTSVHQCCKAVVFQTGLAFLGIKLAVSGSVFGLHCSSLHFKRHLGARLTTCSPADDADVALEGNHQGFSATRPKCDH